MAAHTNKQLTDHPFCWPVPEPERPTLGRENEISDLLDVLYKTRMRNIVLVGPAGCGKTQLVREIASRTRDLFSFYEIGVASAVAGMKYVGDFEKRVTDFLNLAIAEQRLVGKRVVIFVDEIHTCVGAGSNRGERGELDLSNILKPYLSAGRVAVWGATTAEEYALRIEPDSALRRRLPPYPVSPLPPNMVHAMLRGFAASQGMPEAMADEAFELHGDEPDRALDYLDLMMAHARRVGEIK